MEAARKDKASKLSVERVYQKKTQLEHILLRPDTYIGSVEPVTQVSPGAENLLSWIRIIPHYVVAFVSANVGF